DLAVLVGVHPRHRLVIRVAGAGAGDLTGGVDVLRRIVVAEVRGAEVRAVRRRVLRVRSGGRGAGEDLDLVPERLPDQRRTAGRGGGGAVDAVRIGRIAIEAGGARLGRPR